MDEYDFKTFLESVPPNKEILVTNFADPKTSTRTNTTVNTPKLQLHCTNSDCQGTRYFETDSGDHVSFEYNNNKYLTYECCNCGDSYKTFALRARYEPDLKKWLVLKYGETPMFGSPSPARAITLIGGERELFFKGRDCENQGLGIGAFVYYRRVIESQKNRIFDELLRVISKISPNDDVLKEIEAAKKETQFTKAVDAIKHALPQSLFINGYNPLTLLHSALSEGVHEHDDVECLELASSIRTVLFEFADRLGSALKEDANLNDAVNILANKKPKI